MLTQSNRSFAAVRAAAYQGAPPVFEANNSSGSGIEVFVNITSVVNANTLTITIEAVDPLSGQSVVLLQSAAYSTPGLRRLVVHPAITTAANVSASDVLSARYRIRCSHGNATDAITYSVGGNLLLA